MRSGRFPISDRAPGTLPLFPGGGLWRGRRVGLLGGSFNPAHEGHLHISREALKRLDLDCVWWLVSPGNPLKDSREMAPYEERVAAARRLVRHPRIHVSAIEARFGTRYTADTLDRLTRVLPRTHFVWLMGADNLVGFTRWKRWQDIVAMVPLAIFDRDRYSVPGLTGRIATRYRHRRMSVGALKALATAKTPAWTFITLHRYPISATQIRAACGPRPGKSACVRQTTEE